MRTVGWRYDASAVVATVATEAHATAWQRFLPSGPLALLPFRAGGGCSSVVWTTTPRHAAALAALPPDAFAAEVDDALQGRGRYAGASAAGPFAQAVAALAGAVAGGPAEEWVPPPRVGAAPGTAPPAAFPLQFAHAAAYAAPRLALAGDAAHSAHPLAGQGLNLGIADAATLARTLADAVAAGSDIGDALVLRNYARDAATANAPMLAALDGASRRRRRCALAQALTRPQPPPFASTSLAAPVRHLIARCHGAAQRGPGRHQRAARRAARDSALRDRGGAGGRCLRARRAGRVTRPR